MRYRYRSLAMVPTTLLALLTCTGCPEQGSRDAVDPIVSAPLFGRGSDNLSAEEKENVEELLALLRRSSHMLQLTGSRTRVFPSDLEPIPLPVAGISPSGRIARDAPGFPRRPAEVLEWNGESYVVTKQYEAPAELVNCETNEGTTFLFPGTLVIRWLDDTLLLLGRCFPLVVDTETDEEEPLEDARFVGLGTDGLYVFRDGAIFTPESDRFDLPTSAGRTVNGLNERYVVTEVGIYDYRAAEQVLTLPEDGNAAELVASPDGDAAVTVTKDPPAIAIYDLDPTLAELGVRPILLPEFDELSRLRWSPDSGALLAAIRYPDQAVIYALPAVFPGPIGQPIYVDLTDGIVYQFSREWTDGSPTLLVPVPAQLAAD